MAYENTAGLGVTNQYGPRLTGGEQGVYPSAGVNNEFSIHLPVSGIHYTFPNTRNIYVYAVDKTFAKGTISAVSIGGVDVTSASESAPVLIPVGNTGVVVQTGGTGGRIIIRYKNVAEAVYDVVDSVDVAPATATIAVGGTVQLSATVSPDVTGGVNWSSSAPSKATVDVNGLVTGVASGSATITATAKGGSGKTDTAAITVS
jgi:uncharacterized protein YjdB